MRLPNYLTCFWWSEMKQMKYRASVSPDYSMLGNFFKGLAIKEINTYQ